MHMLLSMCQVEAEVQNMIVEDLGKVSYAALGGLSDQIRELRESIELPMVNPDFSKGWNQNPEGCSSLWTSWNWEDTLSESNSQQYRC
ncbi:26S proteasome regulatory subunit 10B homolog A-like [Vigna umbellata]|uniref:26S proteasome regulatory subunit 10B homolog A-like n=1 Tax=Vigna umbellata TaxID=87088 RepID=UPI001F5E8922|nr:26S proteasome regulatory subunit 10B homolog A-like [Vigna umbellata]XP_047177921.1 26S proteasome regulatory subunit 10B homolog A-like [Vigna umbellata]